MQYMLLRETGGGVEWGAAWLSLLAEYELYISVYAREYAIPFGIVAPPYVNYCIQSLVYPLIPC